MLKEEFEYCRNCTRWLLQKNSFDKRCLNCHTIVELSPNEVLEIYSKRKTQFIPLKEKRIIFENRIKQFKNVVDKLNQNIIPDEWILNANNFLNAKLDFFTKSGGKRK